MAAQKIDFPNGNTAVLVSPAAGEGAGAIVETLGLPTSKAVVFVFGGAEGLDPQLASWLTQLFSRGIARAAAEANAMIIDGGTDSGIMKLMGEGVASREYKSPLVGVAPLAKVSYPGSAVTDGTPLEPNHSHFVLTEGADWGAETATLFRLLKQLIRGTAAVPAVAVLAGGGPIARREMLQAVRQNLPVIIVEGSGGLADEIAAASKATDTPAEDPIMAEIIADGELHFHQIRNSVKGIERLIIRELGIDKVLMQAWETFADYDHNATIQQRRFDNLQKSIIYIGVAGTALVIIQEVFAPKTKPFTGFGAFLWPTVHYILILVPISLTVMITAANRFKQGTKWLLLRAGAESIKREIFRYRARAMYYATNAEQVLSQKIESITQRTMRTEVNSSSLIPYNKDKGFPPYMYASQGDDGYTYLNPDRYVEVRLTDQLSFYKRKAVKLERQLKMLFWATFIIGGLGTFLSAINLQVWIALTTALVAAIGTFLGYRQMESTLTKYNQAATDLENVRAWWNALSAEQQASQVNIDSLVAHTEQVLQSELDGWIQQMQNALAELRKDQGTAEEKNEKKEPVEPTKLGAGAQQPPATNSHDDAGTPATGDATKDGQESPLAELVKANGMPVNGGTDLQPQEEAEETAPQGV